MKQLITRLDDALHQRLKRRAAGEGRSVNALVVALLSDGVRDDDTRATVRAHLAATDRLVVPPTPDRTPTREQALEAGRGTRGSVGAALAEERAGDPR